MPAASFPGTISSDGSSGASEAADANESPYARPATECPAFPQAARELSIFRTSFARAFVTLSSCPIKNKRSTMCLPVITFFGHAHGRWQEPMLPAACPSQRAMRGGHFAACSAHGRSGFKITGQKIRALALHGKWTGRSLEVCASSIYEGIAMFLTSRRNALELVGSPRCLQRIRRCSSLLMKLNV